MSRSTFHRQCAPGEAAWQKQLRDRYAHEPSPVAAADLVLKRSEVRVVGRRLALSVILKYEWLGTLPSYCNRFFGLFFGDFCAGVSCFGVGNAGAGVNVHTNLRVERRELAYLARGACVHWAPPGANSRLTAVATRLLAKLTPAPKLVIAYADPDAGEYGTIYQAAGWTCIGRVGKTQAPQWVAPNGRVYESKLIYDLRRQRGGTLIGWRAALRKAGWTEQQPSRKYRYVKVLDRRDAQLVARVAARSVPYPKRAGSIDGDARRSPAARGRFDSDLGASSSGPKR